jgi:excisionase family DNA binding protein
MLSNDASAVPAELVNALADAVAARLATLPTQPEPRFFTVSTASVYTGLSEDSIRNLLSGRKLTALRPVPGRILIDRRELDALIQGSTGGPRTGRGRRGKRT